MKYWDDLVIAVRLWCSMFSPAVSPELDPAGITVPDVFREMRAETDKQKTWAVGQMAVQHYRQKTGRLPPKELRTKASGEGVHCFAVYPEWMRPYIRECIAKVQAEPARQKDLFEVPL